MRRFYSAFLLTYGYAGLIWAQSSPQYTPIINEPENLADTAKSAADYGEGVQDHSQYRRSGKRPRRLLCGTSFQSPKSVLLIEVVTSNADGFRSGEIQPTCARKRSGSVFLRACRP